MDTYYQSLYQAYQNSGKYTVLQLKELEIGLAHSLEVEFYANPVLLPEQMAQIRLGLEHGIDVTPYASASWYNHLQMAEIREGIEAGIDIAYYDDVSYSAEQMHVIRLGLQSSLDVSWYANPIFSISQASLIYEGLKNGLDVRFYADPGYEAEQMLVIKKGLESNVNVALYTDKRFSFMQMTQIRQGLELGIDVHLYAKLSYDEKQMWQIKSGLIDHLDVSCYADPKFNANQMQEIRLGLKSGIDVSLYCDSQFTYEEMRQVRTIFTRHKKTDGTVNTLHTNDMFLREEKIARIAKAENKNLQYNTGEENLPENNQTAAAKISRPNSNVNTGDFQELKYPDAVHDRKNNSQMSAHNDQLNRMPFNSQDFRFNEPNTDKQAIHSQESNETFKSKDFTGKQFAEQKSAVYVTNEGPVYPNPVSQPSKPNYSEGNNDIHTVSILSKPPDIAQAPVRPETKYIKETISHHASSKPAGAPEEVKPKHNVFQMMSNAANEGRPAMNPRELFTSGRNAVHKGVGPNYSAPSNFPIQAASSNTSQV